MAKKSLRIKAMKKPKFSARKYHRCVRCGRVHGVIGKYGLCRLCFRELAYKGALPGVKKAS